VSRAAHGGERIIVHRRKKPAAAVVPIEDLELIMRIEDELEVKVALKALVPL
jgi:PHD/YefM family antitoxin component YafN of YafNO toxin-antitoxin module